MTQEEKLLLSNPPICPNCNQQTWWNFDMTGPGVLHLHCNNCKILISGYHLNQINKVFKFHHKPHSFILVKSDNNIKIFEEV